MARARARAVASSAPHGKGGGEGGGGGFVGASKGGGEDVGGGEGGGGGGWAALTRGENRRSNPRPPVGQAVQRRLSRLVEEARQGEAEGKAATEG